MKIQEICLKDIKPNPFKKDINNGKLNEEIIQKLIEGYKQTTFHENLVARESKNGDIELVYGHHRLESAKRVFGNNHKINIKIYSYQEFSDEKMLIDMIRENLTQRDSNFKETYDSVMLVKRWLEKKHKKSISSREIASFISKSGKAIAYNSIDKYLAISRLPENIRKGIDKGGYGNQPAENKIGLALGAKLSTIENKDEIADLFKVIRKDKELSDENKMKMLTSYKQASNNVKERVRKGNLKLSEVPIENLKEEIKEKVELSKKQKNKKIRVINGERFLREIKGLIGTTNQKIIETCAYLQGLDESGLLYELDWNSLYDIVELANKKADEYQTYCKNIARRL